MYLLLELALTLLAVAWALWKPETFSGFFRTVESHLSRVAHRQKLTVLLVGVVALAARLAVIPVSPIPHPAIQDEFGHLLIADTFAHGKVTNPTHPLWIHFESFSIIERPTYQGFAQPGQGLFLAAGKLIGGHPFCGVWFSLGLLCAAICWMLQAWVSPEWALVGGLIAVARLTTFSYWGASYWGGALAAAAGALVLGALLRIFRDPRPRHAVVMGFALILLANTRPFEGFMFSLPVAAALIVWLARLPQPQLLAALKKVVLPLFLIVTAGLLATSYYFWRVTGSPFRMPYRIHEAQYAIAPYFVWQAAHPQPLYHHEMLRTFYANWELARYDLTRSVAGVFVNWAQRFWWYWLFFLGPLLTLPVIVAILMAPYGTRWSDLSRKLRFLIVLTVIFVLALAVEIPSIPHYAAPLTGAMYALVLMAMRYLRHSWAPRGKLSGVFLTRAIGSICILLVLFRAAAVPLGLPLPPWWPPTWAGPTAIGPNRASIEAELASRPGQHLVIVRYKPSHDPNFEWVYNSADIDNSRIVWARDMGEAANKELFDYYSYRDVWIADADNTPPSLTPLSATRLSPPPNP
jgi:hypothetical protein